MTKPAIGVLPLYDEDKESYWMLPGYLDGLLEAGALPVMLPLTDDRDILEQIIRQYDGFLFTGGHDISPAIYGEVPLSCCGLLCPQRDLMEQKLFSLAYAQDKPVFGICRGIQFINAALGGTLFQDLPSQHPSPVEHHQTPPYDRPVHQVKILEDTPLFHLLKKPALAVNSYHHQAIRKLSPQLKAMAVSEDGLTEAVYAPDKTFVWAVQWHPEFSYKKEEDSRKLFKKFVQAAALR